MTTPSCNVIDMLDILIYSQPVEPVNVSAVGLLPADSDSELLLPRETAVLSYDRHDHEHAGLAHEGGEGPGGDRGACGWVQCP